MKFLLIGYYHKADGFKTSTDSLVKLGHKVEFFPMMQYKNEQRMSDAVIDFKYFLLVIEIDEFQHKRYDEMYERNRMIQIFKDFKGISIVFIRFNPDCYSVRLPNGVKKIVKPNNNERLGELLHLIKRFEFLRDSYEKSTVLPSLSVCYMYYDNYTGEPEVNAVEMSEEIKQQDKIVKLNIIKS